MQHLPSLTGHRFHPLYGIAFVHGERISIQPSGNFISMAGFSMAENVPGIFPSRPRAGPAPSSSRGAIPIEALSNGNHGGHIRVSRRPRVRSATGKSGGTRPRVVGLDHPRVVS